LAASLLLLAPHLPLLFMGEEYGEEHPFQFFCSFSDPQLIEAVRSGRRREFEAFHSDGAQVPDPQAETTFDASRLTWSWDIDPHKAGLRRLYQDVLRQRRDRPALRNYAERAARMLPHPDSGPVLELIRGGRRHDAEMTVRVLFNLSAESQNAPELNRGALLWTSEATEYGGTRESMTDKERMLPYECMMLAPSASVHSSLGRTKG
jgi:maltooligosyltrehalose trehalohydrolase